MHDAAFHAQGAVQPVHVRPFQRQTLADAKPEAHAYHCQRTRKLAQRWQMLPPRQLFEFLRRVIQKVVLHSDRVEVLVSTQAVRALLLDEQICTSTTSKQSVVEGEPIRLAVKVKLMRSRGELTLVMPPDSGGARHQRAIPSLLKAIAKAHVWREQVIAGKMESRRSLARRMGVTERYAGRICECAFLAPDIVEAILDGRQPPNLTFQALTSRLPMAWGEQRELLGFAPKSH